MNPILPGYSFLLYLFFINQNTNLMGFFDRLSNGWTIAKNSFAVLKENKQLLIFPVLAGASMILILGSFVAAVLGYSGRDADNAGTFNTAGNYALVFGYYIVNYFIVVFFNMALVHCTSLYFKGEEVTIRKGLEFSKSRIGTIFMWALFAGSVGALLRIVQENLGTIGKIITGLLGIVWSIATFFVVPILAYENAGPIDAFKRSAEMMKNKWGERIGAGFSFGLINLICGLIIAAIAFIIGAALNVFAGIVAGILGILLLAAIMSAVKTVFVSAVYHNIQGDPVENYNQQFIDNLFMAKR